MLVHELGDGVEGVDVGAVLVGLVVGEYALLAVILLPDPVVAVGLQQGGQELVLLLHGHPQLSILVILILPFLKTLYIGLSGDVPP